jgi:hypothetical protein
MQGKHDVYVFQAGDGAFKVRPGVASARAGKTVSFRNVTPFPVTLTFPPGLMLEGTNPPPIGPGPNNPPNDTAVFNVNPGANDFFEYQVNVADGSPDGKMAYGDSDPGMIVDQ